MRGDNMRGKVSRRAIRVERAQETVYSVVAGYEEIGVTWEASFDSYLRNQNDLNIESLSLSFTGDSYDEALDKLLAEFERLDIEVVV